MRKYIVGVDEAGRGPLAGPVTVGAVAVPVSKYKFLISKHFKGIKDSKQLLPSQRYKWFKVLKSHPDLICIASSVSHKVIDKKGIVPAVRFAVSRCLKKLSVRQEMQNKKVKVLLDGAIYAPKKYDQETIIKGDEEVSIISAASIIAKVIRDRKMIRLAKNYPEYNFHTNKGYGTFRHRAIIKEIGLCDIHRRSYCARLV